MARPSNTDERRQQISDALLRVMGQHGYHQASITKIAEEAGLAPGLVLYHFGAKADILLHAVQTLVSSLEQRFETRMARAGDDPRAAIEAFIDAHLALGDDADEASVAAWVVIAEQALRDPDVRALYSESVVNRLATLDGLIRAHLRAGGHSTRGAKHMAAAMLSAIEGSFVLSVAAPGVLPRGYAAPMVRAMLDGLIAESNDD